MLERVFHERLQQQRGNSRRVQLTGNIDVDAEAILEPGPLHGQIRLDDVQLLAQRHELGSG